MKLIKQGERERERFAYGIILNFCLLIFTDNDAEIKGTSSNVNEKT